MTVTSLDKDLDAGTLTIVTEYPATVAQVWRLWSDPRRLERWWGPPSHPATVTDHDLSPGGVVRYFMTGPDGERYPGGWEIIEVDEPTHLVFEDYFANADGTENTDFPRSRTVVSIADHADMATMTIETKYPSPEAMTQALEMGMEEGIRRALGQTDALLAEEPA